ncbi:MAG: hypothetical protein RQ722_09620, partial [Desulfuromonadales bacterium]|nr:hypothetical protein [Desulfuromonadales bacterium]
MNNESQKATDLQYASPPEKRPGQNWLKILGIVVIATVLSTLLVLWAVHAYLFPGSFKPVTLSAGEEQILESKLERLETM